MFAPRKRHRFSVLLLAVFPDRTSTALRIENMHMHPAKKKWNAEDLSHTGCAWEIKNMEGEKKKRRWGGEKYI